MPTSALRLRQQLARNNLLHRRHPRHKLLMNKSSNSNHGQATIDNLRILEPTISGRVGAKAKRVKCKLSRFTWRVERDHLNDGRHTDNHLPHANPKQELYHRALRHAPIVNGPCEPRGTIVKREGEVLRDNHAQHGKHANTTYQTTHKKST